MKIITETVSPFSENTYFLVEPQSLATVVVDPGDEAPRLLERIKSERLKVEKILLTHAHLDHVGAAAELQRETGAPVYLHADEMFLLEGLPAQAQLFGLREPEPPRIDEQLKEGDVIVFGAAVGSGAGDDSEGAGGLRIEVMETPGHSPGSVTFVVEGTLVSGDVLFAGGIGRTDLPGGDYDVLMASIRDRLLVFPDDTPVYPGHGPATTIGREKRNNPFLQSD